MSDYLDEVEKPTKVGILSLVDIEGKEMDDLLEYLGKVHKTEVFDSLYGVFGKDFLKFIDCFSEETIKVPSRDVVFKSIKYLKIYKYCKDRNFTEESIELAAKVFDKRKNSIRRIIEKVRKTEEQ